ncbi:MAG: GAF domain-containing protein [Anaerolineae bacterium]|nr:GAF domain-containing protein [Anaerolineae bacterium]
MDDGLTTRQTEAIHNIDIWRQKLVRQLLVALSIIGGPVAAMAVYQAYIQNYPEQIPIRLGIYLLLIGITLWKRSSYKTQVLVIIGVFGGFGLFNMTQFGINGDSSYFLLSAAVLSSLFFDRWRSRGSIAILLLGLLGMAWALTSGYIIVYYPGTTTPRSTEWEGWLLSILIFLAMSIALGHAQTYLLNHLASALTQSHQLTQELRVERAELEQQIVERTRNAETARAEAESTNEALQMQMWLVTGEAQFNESLRGEQDLVTLANHIICQLCTYIEVPVGALYFREGNKLQLLGRYAYTSPLHHPGHFQLGEGWIGQVAQEQRLQILDTITDTTGTPQLIVASGLGQTHLRYILGAPFLYEGQVNGVLELGSSRAFTDTQINFVEKMLETIAIALNTAENRARINTLLEETQRQANELQAQEEELRAINEELEAQTEHLRHQQEQMLNESRARISRGEHG